MACFIHFPTMKKLYLSLLLFLPLVVAAHHIAPLRAVDCLDTPYDTAPVAPQEPGTAALSMDPTGQVVVADTTGTAREAGQWVSLLTVAPRFGFKGMGFSVQFYGYKYHPSRRWSIPLHWSYGKSGTTVESYRPFPDNAYLQYVGLGISPLYRLNDYFYLNLGLSGHFGQEELQSAYQAYERKTLYGISASQGVYFISRSRFGLTIGVGIYEKIMGWDEHQSDQGVKVEVGVKL